MTQAKVGWRAYVSPLSSLLTSIYGVWNGDGTNNTTVKNAWNANGNANDSKGSANGTIATPSGTGFVAGSMTFGSGKLGSGAITFSGSNFISLPNNTLKFTGDFSASYWIYVPTSFGTNSSRVLSAFDNSAGYTTYKGWDTSYSNGKMSLYIYPGLGTDYYGITVPMTLKDQWVHVTVTKVLGQQGNIYINGVAGVKTVDQRGSGASTQAIGYNVSNLAYMGSSYFAFSLPYYTPTVAGGFKIDAIQTWDGAALDQTAVTELYNSGNGQEYPFTTSNALIGSPNDSVSANHGTLMNGATFTTGKIGQAFRFDGINDYVSLPNTSGEFNFNGNFTVSTWFRSSNLSASRYFMSNYQNNGSVWGYGWSFYYSSSLGFAFQLDNGAVTNRVNFQSGYGANIWYHVVVVRTMGQKHKIYVNGVDTPAVQSSGNVNTNAGYIANQKMDLGGISPLNAYALCDLDAVSIWNRALTAEEVTNLYNTGTGKQYPNY
jgi:hypothetical protein